MRNMAPTCSPGSQQPCNLKHLAPVMVYRPCLHSSASGRIVFSLRTSLVVMSWSPSLFIILAVTKQPLRAAIILVQVAQTTYMYVNETPNLQPLHLSA